MKYIPINIHLCLYIYAPTLSLNFTYIFKNFTRSTNRCIEFFNFKIISIIRLWFELTTSMNRYQVQNTSQIDLAAQVHVYPECWYITHVANV